MGEHVVLLLDRPTAPRYPYYWGVPDYRGVPYRGVPASVLLGSWSWSLSTAGSP